MQVKKTVEVEVNGKKTKKTITTMEEKDIAYVEDVDGFAKYVTKERNLNPATTSIVVGADGGGGSLKIMASIFDPTVETEEDEDDDDDDDDDDGDDGIGDKENTKESKSTNGKRKTSREPKMSG